MSYLTPPAKVIATTRIYELSLSTAQTVNSGDVVKFDTVRVTTSGGGVSNNSSTGDITLNSSYRYFLQCSFDITRASITDSIRVAFFNSTTNAELTVSEGSYDATWTYHSKTSTYAQPNPTFQAEYIPVGIAVSPIQIKVFDVSNNSQINTNFSLIIVESVL